MQAMGQGQKSLNDCRPSHIAPVPPGHAAEEESQSLPSQPAAGPLPQAKQPPKQVQIVPLAVLCHSLPDGFHRVTASSMAWVITSCRDIPAASIILGNRLWGVKPGMVFTS